VNRVTFGCFSKRCISNILILPVFIIFLSNVANFLRQHHRRCEIQIENFGRLISRDFSHGIFSKRPRGVNQTSDCDAFSFLREDFFNALQFRKVCRDTKTPTPFFFFADQCVRRFFIHVIKRDAVRPCIRK
jgi:hypothetical protein